MGELARSAATSLRGPISRTHMSRIEMADCAVSLDVIFELCNVLDITPKQ